jgi:hypothetical protein
MTYPIFNLAAPEVTAARNAQHVIRREKNGTGWAAEYTPVCACGWRGRPESESNDYMSTNLRDQERAHMTGSHA